MSPRGYAFLGIAATTLALLAACAGDGKRNYDNPNRLLRATSSYFAETPNYSSSVVSDEELTSLSASRIELGRKLFGDTRLSVNRDMSCATCHNPNQGFTQTNRTLPEGARHQDGGRNAPSLYDVVSRDVLFHDGRATSLTAQASMPLLNPSEMGNPSMEVLAARVRAMPDYDRFFSLAFSQAASAETITTALAAYQTTLITGPNRFDLWKYRGRGRALKDAEIRGYELFIGKAGCVACHQIGSSYASFTDNGFHDTGYSTTKPVAYATVDTGRFAVSKNAKDKFAFRTPSLRNVALTAPYMHDGRLRTLHEVVAFFNAADELGLTAVEQAEIVAFLGALTSKRRP